MRARTPFDYIENNFLAGCTFDWDDINRKALVWWDKVNSTHRRYLHGAPRELFVPERARMKAP